MSIAVSKRQEQSVLLQHYSCVVMSPRVIVNLVKIIRIMFQNGR